MAITDFAPYKNLVRAVRESPVRSFWVDYDEDADVLYVNFEKPKAATDAEMTDEDVIIRYDGDKIIGLTILHAGHR